MQNSAGQRERIMERGSSRQPCHPSSSCTGQPVQRVVSSVLQSKAKKKAAMRRLPLFIFNRCTLRYWGHTYKHRRATLRMMMGTHMCLAVDMLHLFCLFFFYIQGCVPPTCGIGLPRKNAHEMNRWIETSRCLLECVQTLSRTIANGAAIIDESRPVQRPRRPRRRKRLESTYSHGDIQNTNGPCIQPLPTGYRVCTRFATTQQTRERERVKGLMKITTWPSGSHEQNGGQRSKNPSYGMLPCPAI